MIEAVNAVDIFLEISGFFPVKIMTKNINPNKLALGIDQGILVNTGVDLDLMVTTGSGDLVDEKELNFQKNQEYLRYNFSILKYEREWDDILGDNIKFEVVNPKIDERYTEVAEVLGTDENGTTKKTFTELKDLFPTLVLIFDIGIWKPILEHFSSEQVQPVVYPIQANSTLNDLEGKYLEFTKQNRSHCLTSIIADEGNSVSFGVYKLSKDKTTDETIKDKPLQKLYEFRPQPNACTRYIEIP